jgi:anion-transporting  ArsA/GET3 family ATPase
MAMEKLLELSADERFDLVVLDTPPTRHALDFLDAPDRLVGFLDTSVLRWFLKPYFVAGRLTLKVATRTGAFALELADRVLGLQFLQDLSEFFLAFEGMYEGFKQRAGRVHSLLRDEDSGFVLVAGPSRATLDEALYFYRRLRERDMPFVGLVVNRVHPDPLADREAVPRTPARVHPELARALLRLMEDQSRVAGRERRGIARLAAEVSDPLVLVPEMDADVHDLRGLREVGERMLGGRGSASSPRRRKQLQAEGRR